MRGKLVASTYILCLHDACDVLGSLYRTALLKEMEMAKIDESRLAFIRRWLADLVASPNADADLVAHLRRCEADMLRAAARA